MMIKKIFRALIIIENKLQIANIRVRTTFFEICTSKRFQSSLWMSICKLISNIVTSNKALYRSSNFIPRIRIASTTRQDAIIIGHSCSILNGANNVTRSARNRTDIERCALGCNTPGSKYTAVGKIVVFLTSGTATSAATSSPSNEL